MSHFVKFLSLFGICENYLAEYAAFDGFCFVVPDLWAKLLNQRLLVVGIIISQVVRYLIEVNDRKVAVLSEDFGHTGFSASYASCESNDWYLNADEK